MRLVCNKDVHSVPVGGPVAFVSIGSTNHFLTKVDPDLMAVVMYLSS